MSAAPKQAISVFTFAPGLNLRVIDKAGGSWFVAADVGKALGYSNTSEALHKHVDDDDRCHIDLNTVTKREGMRGNPRVSCINESGLYSLILSSRMPEAKAFKKWVTSEVLPSIRKHGGYLTPEVAHEVTESPSRKPQKFSYA